MNQKISSALQIFNGSKHNITLEQLKRLNEAQFKTIFRKRLHSVHPDKAQVLGIPEQRLTYEFKKIYEAYLIIGKYIKEQKIIYHSPPFQEKQPPEQQKPAENYSHSHFKSAYFRGKIPLKKLRFAEYLYYSGRISWKALIHSLAWQHKNRPKLGQIGLKLNYFNNYELTELIKENQILELIGVTAVRTNLIDDYRLHVLLGLQKKYDLPIGRFFILAKILTPDQLTNLLLNHQRHNLQHPGFSRQN